MSVLEDTLKIIDAMAVLHRDEAMTAQDRKILLITMDMLRATSPMLSWRAKVLEEFSSIDDDGSLLDELVKLEEG
jgi:hypothetical protein